ncbi:MAG: hypothetical protein KDI30_08400 [Pseudomonadales bacterium]|nr:hypothetical protein [Pseudomonadales bacterium]
MPLTIKLVRNSILSVLLFFAVMASSIYIYWGDLRSFVTEFDTDVREYYLARVQTPYKLLAEQLQNQSPVNEDILKQLFELEEKLSEVQYTDRLTPVKEDLLLQLSRYYEKQSDFDKALTWQQKLIDFVPKNIDYQYQQVELLFKSGNNEAAMEKLAGLFELLPENNRVASRYLPALIDNGMYDKAYEGLISYLRLRTDATRNEWGYYWSENKSFSREFSDFTYPAIEPGVINLEFTVPEKTAFVRVVLPNHSVLMIQDVESSVFHNNAWHPLPEKLLQTQNIQRSKKFMRATGKAFQALTINNIPADLRAKAAQKIRLKISYMDDIDWVSSMLEHPELHDFLSGLEQQERYSDIRYIKKAIFSSLRKSLIVVSLGNNKFPVNTGLNLNPSNGKLQFRKPLKRDTYRDYVELIFPDTIAARYQLRLQTGHSSANEIIPTLKNSENLLYDAISGQLTVTGKNPSLTIDLSSLPDDIALTVKGEVL